MAKLMVVISRAVVAGVNDGDDVSDGRLRELRLDLCQMCACMCLYGTPGDSLEVVCAPEKLGQRWRTEERSGDGGNGSTTASASSGLRAARERRGMD
uniref:Uncharacterized protein n=1 Tax=Oryza barthii TaxID=65489 RepID=A0A0D3HTK2_9ORYZ